MAMAMSARYCALNLRTMAAPDWGGFYLLVDNELRPEPFSGGCWPVGACCARSLYRAVVNGRILGYSPWLCSVGQRGEADEPLIERVVNVIEDPLARVLVK